MANSHPRKKNTGGRKTPPRKKRNSAHAKILVTGGAGSVGTLLVDLLLDAGYTVKATDRPGAPPPEPRSGLEWVAADLTNPHHIPDLTAKVDAIIHTAAWVDISVPFEKQAPINLEAVKRLYAAAQYHGVKRFIHFSTGSLYAAKAEPLHESDPLHPTSAYELTKLLAEDFLHAQRGDDITTTILRPALIYGPRGKVLVAPIATVPTLLKPVDGWIPQLVGGPRTNLVHALDVARAALHLLEHPQPDGATFNVACDDVISLGQLVGIVLDSAGFRTRGTLPFPKRLIDAVYPLLGYSAPVRYLNAIVGVIWKHIVKKEQLVSALFPRLDVEAMPYLMGNVIFDATALKRTGFTFRFNTFREGWQDTLAWYRNARWLPTDKNATKQVDCRQPQEKAA